MLGRREVLAGGAAAFAASGPAAAQAAKLGGLAFPALADNAVARTFRPVRNLTAPDVALLGPAGSSRLSVERRRLTLLAIWAEWCAPCLLELPHFARLQAAHGDADFRILPVLSGGRADPARAGRLMAKMGAGSLTPWVEGAPGNRLHSGLTGVGALGIKVSTLPCNLVLDGGGRVIARQLFGPSAKGPDGKSTGTIWATPAADAFVAALAAGRA